MRTAPMIMAAICVLRAVLLQREYIQMSSLRDRFYCGIVGHLAAPDRTGAAPTRPYGDILLAIHDVGGGNADDAGTELRAGPQYLPGLGIEGHEMPVGAAAEHQTPGGGHRGAGPRHMGFVLPDLFAGIQVNSLHRAPVGSGWIVLDFEGFIEERQPGLVRDRLRALDVHAGVLGRDVGHLGLWID